MININIEQDTEKKLKYILSFHTNKDIVFRKFINYQIHELQSKKFYQKFTDGKTDDSQDTLIWAGLYEVFTENNKQIALLK